MAISLINGTYTELQDAIDSVLRSIYSIGSDTYNYGKKYINSRVGSRDNSNTYKLTQGSNSGLTINGGNSSEKKDVKGIIPFILNTDISNEQFKSLRVNPACNFATGAVDKDKLVAYGSHSNIVDDDDTKYGYIQYPKDAVVGANRNQSIKACVWTAGKAVGTFKQLVTGVDIVGDVTSGINVYRTYYTTHGWSCNISGITNEYEITDGNSYKINMLTGERTEIPDDSPLKSIGYPYNYGDVVEIDDYIYIIDKDGYIEKINKSTLVLEVKNTDYNYDNKNYNLLKINDELYMCYKRNNNDAQIKKVDINSLNLQSDEINTLCGNLPEYMQYNSEYKYQYISIHNIDNNFILYNSNKKFGLCCSDLSDIAGTVIPELCQFNIEKSSYRKLTDTVACFYISESNTGDLTINSSGSLNVSLDNGQVLSISEWETPFENRGNKEISITLAV